MAQLHPAAPPVAALDVSEPATRPHTPTEERTRPLSELLPPHRVLLHNDELNAMEQVVHALLASVPELDERRATEVMLEAHQHGQAEVIVCPLERAELYRDRLQSFGLTATIERAER